MSNHEDRSWMYDRVNSGGYLNQSFIEGVQRFLEYASSQTNLLNRGKVKCPCKQCCNSKFHTKDNITCHLYKRGFLPEYYVWVAHGESFGNTEGASSSYVPVPSPVHETFGGRYRELVDDTFGGRFEDINFNQGVEEEPSADVRYFNELLQKSHMRISSGEQETVLEFVSKFMTNKILTNTTAAGCIKWLKQLHTVLNPVDRKLIPEDVNGMKRVLKRLGLEKKTYDLCWNNCFLYYGEYETSSYTQCPVCGYDRFEPARGSDPRAKRISKKKLWYFPLTSRLQRLYMSRHTSEHMTWHLECRGQNDMMIHPAAGKAWKSFDDKYPDYAAEPRNVRLGLCTDGFTPWGSFGNTYSCWPVFITPYNLPPGMCMRQEYIFLSLLIPGPKGPGKNLDVMLRPIIDELHSLWKHGAQTYDSFRKQNFVMRAHLMWTISDFPAYGMLSQWSTHGEDAKDPPLLRRSGAEMKKIVECLPYIEFGNNGEVVEDFGVKHNWCRRGIFWELPYWESNLIRHNLDVMHCEKNFFDNIKNTVMDDPDKTKDNLKARKDLQEWTTRSDLFPIRGRNGQWNKRKEYLVSCVFDKEIKCVIIRICDPLMFLWVYRRMQELKKAVKNKAHVEGSIAEEYLISEVTNFLQHYFENSFETRANRLNRNEVALDEEFHEELSIFHVKGEALGRAARGRYLSTIEYRAAELYILLNCLEVEPWLRLFDEQMCVGLPVQQIQSYRNMYFVDWIKGVVASRQFNVDPRIIALVGGPINAVSTFDGYMINGFRFHTSKYNKHKKTNNNGVYVKGDDAEDSNFYGILQEVIGVDYWGSGRALTVILFKCDWYDLSSTGMKKHPIYPLVDINPNCRLPTGVAEPFILATQAQQACYFTYACQSKPVRRGWVSAQTTKARHLVDTTSLNIIEESEGPEIFQDDTAPLFRLDVDLSSYNIPNLADYNLEPVAEEPMSDQSEDEGPYYEEPEDSDPDYA